MSRFKLLIVGTPPVRDEIYFLTRSAPAVLCVLNEPLGGKTVSGNGDSLLAEIIGHISPIRLILNRFNPVGLKGDRGFLVMRDRLKMHGLGVAGKLSSERGRAEEKKKNIGHICPVSHIPLHKEIIS
ncbi:MAG: hypothetical protein FD156_1235 [Nitrospirae bacterium]|nr:MAG: hypothetical protein FD156_1235 [Nitrospirota bacterium]